MNNLKTCCMSIICACSPFSTFAGSMLQNSRSVQTINVSPTTGIADKDGYFSVWSASGDVPLVLRNGFNNMYYSNGTMQLYYGKSQSPYDIVSSGFYKITGYRITFSNSDASKNTTITPTEGGQAVTCYDSGSATLEVSGLSASSTSFNITTENNANVAANIIEFRVYLELIEQDESVKEENIVLFDSKTSLYPYRIPALSVTRDGSLLAFTDYRPCGSDIGNGDVDINLRISHDNGKTWGDEVKILDGSGSGNTAGYGDAAVVADRESDDVRLVCVTGDVTFSNSGRGWNGKMRIATSISHDNGKTWESPKDITNQIYGAVDVKGLFFTSGRIVQSKKIKVGNYYRIYSVLCTNNSWLWYDAKDNENYVLYSDDLGETWHKLGGRAISQGDEAKCEELPDGNLLVSSRMSGGRKFNIFTYSDQSSASGSWGSQVTENNAFSNVASCNGELLITEAIRTSDNTPVTLLLHSLSHGSREDVGIYYKELDKYSSPSDFTNGWQGPYQVSDKASAYSAMQQTPNGNIAIFFEDDIQGSGYQMTYRNLDLNIITGGKYHLSRNESIDKDGILELLPGSHLAEVSIKADAESSGQVTADGGEVSVDAITLQYTATPGKWNFISFPADCDIRTASNLESLGYTFGNPDKTFYLMEYDEAARASGKSAWKMLEEPIASKYKGYLFGISRSADNPEDNPVEITFTLSGESIDEYINNRDVQMEEIDYHPSDEASESGWNLIGMPSARNINVTAQGTVSLDNVSPYIYTYNNGNDTYSTYTAGMQEEMNIKPFGAYFIQATSSGASFTVQKSSYSALTAALQNAGNAPATYSDSPVRKLRLRLADGTSGKEYDRTDIRFTSEASRSYVFGEDALKMWGGLNNEAREIASISGERYLSVNVLPDDDSETPLFLNIKSPGEFTIVPEAESFDPSSMSLSIYDIRNSTEYDLLQDNAAYTFSVGSAEDAGQRFLLRYRRETTAVDNTETATEAVITSDGNRLYISRIPEGSSISVFDLQGIRIKHFTSTSESCVLNLPKGIYILKTERGGNASVKKVTVH